MIWAVIILTILGSGVILCELHLPSLELKEENYGCATLWGPLCLACAFLMSFFSKGFDGLEHFQFHPVLSTITGALLLVSITLSWIYCKGVPPLIGMLLGTLAMPYLIIEMIWSKSSSTGRTILVIALLLLLTVGITTGFWYSISWYITAALTLIIVIAWSCDNNKEEE